MSDETSGSAGPGPGRRASGTSRAVRLGIGAALVAVGVLVGGAVAFAVDDSGGGESEAELAAHEHALAGDTSDTTADTTAGTGTGTGTGQGHGHGGDRAHQHPTLPPYEQRYAAASPEDQAAADALRADVSATLTAYQDVDAAVAAGYRPPRNPNSPREHYMNPAVASEGHVLDPTRPNGLVYYTGGDGAPVLLGAVFIAPPGTEAPTPAGDLVVWHSHDPACPAFYASEDAPCTDVRRMLHVWTADQVEMVSRRTGRTAEVAFTDPFGAPFGASIIRVVR